MKERGQSLVELAISFTLLMMLLSGLVEFGMVFFQFIELRDAVQEGALYGSMNPESLLDIETRARGASNTPIDLRNQSVSITIAYSGAPCEGNDNSITVTMKYNHKVFMPFLSNLIPNIPLRAWVTDTIIYPQCK